MLQNRWTALAALCFVRVWMGFQFQSIPPIAPLLVEELGFNHTQVGLLIGLFMLPGILIALPGAMLGSRIGDRNTVMLGLTETESPAIWGLSEALDNTPGLAHSVEDCMGYFKTAGFQQVALHAFVPGTLNRVYGRKAG